MKALGVGCVASCIGLALALLTGCGGLQPQADAPGLMPEPPQALRGTPTGAVSALEPALRSREYKALTPLLYVANYSATYNDVRVYRARANDPAPLATISDGIDTPSGTCVDDDGTLYVTNQPPSSSGWISEYPRGKTTPSRIITHGVNTPAFCATDAKGNLWVTNIGGVNVTEYLRGSAKSHIVITNSLTFPVGIAIDHSGNLYVGNGWDAAQKNVEVFAPGSKSPSRTITNGVTWPVGIAVDSNGTLYVANTDQNNVTEYRSGQDSPFQTITKSMNFPVSIAVNKQGVLYVTDSGNNTVVEFPPGSLTPSKRQISKGLYGPNGIAYYPALLP
jgi:NHL repeat